MPPLASECRPALSPEALSSLAEQGWQQRPLVIKNAFPAAFLTEQDTKASFFRLHKDAQDVFTFVIAGWRRFLLWPFDTFSTLAGTRRTGEGAPVPPFSRRDTPSGGRPR